MEKVIGLGAGGHSKVVIDALLLTGHYEIVGLLDPNEALWGTKILGVPVLGEDALLPNFLRDGVGLVFIGVGSTSDTSLRSRLYLGAKELGFGIAEIIHPNAVIALSAHIGQGPTIMAGAIINAAATLGNNVIINTGAVIEHDCNIGDHAHVATGARLAGTVDVGTMAHVGAGAVVRENITIGDGAIVGAGAAVIDDVLPGSVVGGVPARALKLQRPDEANRLNHQSGGVYDPPNHT